MEVVQGHGCDIPLKNKVGHSFHFKQVNGVEINDAIDLICLGRIPRQQKCARVKEDSGDVGWRTTRTCRKPKDNKLIRSENNFGAINAC